MTNENEPASTDLIAADSGASKELAEQERAFRDLIEKETRFEEKLERLLKITWSVTLASIVVLAGCFTVLQNSQEWGVDAARTISLIAAMVGAIGLVVAMLSTFSWLFRSRSVSLTAVERRLASIERSLNARESE